METDKSGVSAYKSGVDEGRESQEPTLALDSVANGSNGNTKVDDDDDDTPQLSAHTLAALQQFYSEQEALRELMEKSTISVTNDGDDNTENVEADTNKALFQTDLTKNFPEDWVTEMDSKMTPPQTSDSLSVKDVITLIFLCYSN